MAKSEYECLQCGKTIVLDEPIDLDSEDPYILENTPYVLDDGTIFHNECRDKWYS